ncbi:accessory gland protein Acp29AB-like [Drosophila teissieri]|uniref:accessory gland protein Acp29AB-like n=1 Tax=Drosophila teissieri TaxID=7243 RepID=UPI001CB9F9BA|nr:accessory gland protein Acp29AB-like [Drosophila teissieri]
MQKLSISLLLAFFACHARVSTAATQSVCLLQDAPQQCSEFCLTVLRPMLDHIARHQEEWSSGILEANETEARLARIEALQTATHSRQKVLQEGFPKDIGSRLDRLESQQAALLRILTRFDRKIVPPKFELIGSRYFYIEDETRRNWTSAASCCRQMGAQLATIRSAEELASLKAKLNKERSYWLGITDLAKEGDFRVSATGKRPNFFKWRAGQPNNFSGNQHCVDLLDGLMYDNKCEGLGYFLCQSDDDSLD